MHKGQTSTSENTFVLYIYQCGCGLVCSIKTSLSAASARLFPFLEVLCCPKLCALLMYLCKMPEFTPKSPRLEVVPRLVLGLCGCEVVFQKGLDVFEGRPLIWILLPAVPHHLVEGLGAALGAGHAVASFYLLKYLSIHHTCRKHKEI